MRPSFLAFDMNSRPFTDIASHKIVRYVRVVSNKIARTIVGVIRRRAFQLTHALPALLAQRVCGMALGYEDIIDHDTLRFDPALKLLASPRTGDPGTPAPLAGKSTLNRLEQSWETGNRSYHQMVPNLKKLSDLFVTLFLDAHQTPPARIGVRPMRIQPSKTTQTQTRRSVWTPLSCRRRLNASQIFPISCMRTPVGDANRPLIRQQIQAVFGQTEHETRPHPSTHKEPVRMPAPRIVRIVVDGRTYKLGASDNFADARAVLSDGFASSSWPPGKATFATPPAASSVRPCHAPTAAAEDGTPGSATWTS